MNYRDYVEIMDSEGLTLPDVAKYTLEEAKKCQRIIKKLKSETNFDTKKQVKEMEEKKIGWILEAIEMARMAKENPDIMGWADRQLERQIKKDKRG